MESILVFILGALSIYIGISGIAVGFCFTKWEGVARCCAGLYAIKSLILFLIFLILGLIFLALSKSGVTYITEICNNTLGTVSSRE